MDSVSDWDRASLLDSEIFSPLHDVIRRLDAHIFPTQQTLNALLAAQSPAVMSRSGLPIHFVAQECGKLPFERQYEPLCYLTGGVQTRENNWHDLLNALIWLVFPQAKAAINARHFRALTVPGARQVCDSASQRGRVRDTCTLLDESGVIVASCDPDLSSALQAFRWKELFWERRADLPARMKFFVFGHGLYEKALHPYIGMTGQGLLLPVDEAFFVWPDEMQRRHLDERIAAYVSDEACCLSSRELTPVPLLGMPGWHPDNENPGFYENTAYFRVKRRP